MLYQNIRKYNYDCPRESDLNLAKSGCPRCFDGFTSSYVRRTHIRLMPPAKPWTTRNNGPPLCPGTTRDAKKLRFNRTAL